MLGEARYPSPVSRFVCENLFLPEQILGACRRHCSSGHSRTKPMTEGEP
jgi:hypothetical protein